MTALSHGPDAAPHDEARRQEIASLLQRYAPLVRSICAARLGCTNCDDLQQEAFLRVLRNSHRVRAPHYLPAYLRAITRNLCADHLRARRLRPRLLQVEDEWLDGIPDSAETSDDRLGDVAQLRRQIARLPDSLRTVLELFYLARLDYAQIATRTGITIGAVGQRLSRARRRLREAVQRRA